MSITRYKTLVKTKLLEDKYLEIREYEMFKYPLKVIHCVAPDYKSCTHLGEEYQTFTLEQQKRGKVVNTLQSKFYPFAYYRMYKFLWKPKHKVENEVYSDKDIQFVGNKAILIV